MGKLRKLSASIILSVALLSCKQEALDFNEGVANIEVIEGEERYELDLCYCWIVENSIKVKIGELAYSSISIVIEHKIDRIEVGMERWSDTNDLDGEYTQKIHLTSKNVTISYNEQDEKMIISGKIEINSNKNDSNNVIKALGTFSCDLPHRPL